MKHSTTPECSVCPYLSRCATLATRHSPEWARRPSCLKSAPFSDGGIMRFVTALFVPILLVLTTTADAATIFFGTDPFLGSTAQRHRAAKSLAVNRRSHSILRQTSSPSIPSCSGSPKFSSRTASQAHFQPPTSTLSLSRTPDRPSWRESPQTLSPQGSQNLVPDSSSISTPIFSWLAWSIRQI